jgi:hypothetical protein
MMLYSMSYKAKAKEVYLVGDCVAARNIPEAIREGHLIGRRIYSRS